MTNKKKAVKVFSGFLAAMLVMTFVSRAVYAKNLPCVTVSEAKQQRLTRVIKCGGTVVPTAVKSVFLPEGLTVEQMIVSPGCAVEKDSELIRLDKAQLEEKALTLESEIADEKNASVSEPKYGTPVFAEPDMPVSEVKVRNGDTVKAGDTLFTVDLDRLLILINELEAERNTDMINRDGCTAAAEKAEEDELTVENAAQQRVQAEVYECSIEQKQRKIGRYLEVYNCGGKICAPCGGTVTAVKIGSGDVTSQSAAVLIGDEESVCSSISEKEKLLERYHELIKNDGIVKSTAAGTVTSAEITAGQQTTASAALCIADNTAPLCFRAELTEEDAAQISAGDTAEVVLHNGRLRLDDCRIDSVVKQSGGYIAAVRVEDPDIRCSDIGELRVQSTAEESSICVPTSAVRGGSDQKYVFILKTEDGFLGEEYHAERINVTADKSNDTLTSLSGCGLTEGDKVICTDKKLSDGQTVRYSDNTLQ